MDITYLLSISTIILLGAFVYLKKCYTYWEKRGLYSLEPDLFYGNIKLMIKRKLSVPQQFQKFYNEFRAKGLKHGGVYVCFRPAYVPVDMELLKCILQKDFSHFMNHGFFSNPKVDPLSGNLFNLEGSKWRNLRMKLTPTFTSGKIKMMFHTLVDCSVALNEILGECAGIEDAVNIKGILERFTADIVGSCAFGINCNCLKNPDAEFIKYGRKIFEIDFEIKLKILMMMLIPKHILTKTGFRTTKKDVEAFFMNMVRDTVEYREKNKIFRKDFMHLMLQLKNMGEVTDDERITDGGEKQHSALTIEEIAAQCFVFFAGGFETSSTTMTFALYELSIDQGIQEKLRQEIKSVLKKHDGKMTYEAVMEMTYLDKVINETLRKYPPIGALPRVCTETYKVPGTDVVIEADTVVQIPVLGIHYDPEYYPNPDVFDPDRFNEENIAKRPSYAFIPFGEGPRICIGLRFGLLQTKVGLITVINNYRVTLNDKTSSPIEIDPVEFITSAKGGVWLNISKLE